MRITTSSLFLLSALAGTAWAGPAQLANKAPLYVEQEAGSPRERIFLIFQGGGGALEPKYQGAIGILNEILNEGPLRLSATDYKKQLFLLNSEVSFFSTPRANLVLVTAPPEKVQETLNLVMETIHSPKLDDANFAKAMDKTANAVAQREDSMGSTIRYVALRDAFEYHPDVRGGSTSRLALKNVDLNVVKAKLPILYNQEYLMFGAAGPVEAPKLTAVLNEAVKKNGFQDKTFKAYPYKNAVFKPLAPETGRITILNKPKAVDNQVLMLTRRALPRDNTDMLAFSLANDALGNGSSGALARTLREERGLTYYAGTGEDVNLGYWVVMSFASTDKVEPLLKGIDELVKNQGKLNLDAAAADILKNQQLRTWKEGRELPSDKLQIATETTLYGRSLEFQRQFDKELMKVSPEAINHSAKENFSMQYTKIYLMGDKDKLVPIVKKLGYKDKNIRVLDLDKVL